MGKISPFCYKLNVQEKIFPQGPTMPGCLMQWNICRGNGSLYDLVRERQIIKQNQINSGKQLKMPIFIGCE
jgi:hypothetical protein